MASSEDESAASNLGKQYLCRKGKVLDNVHVKVES